MRRFAESIARWRGEAALQVADCEYLDVLFAFGRYERELALLRGPGKGLSGREIAVREAVCLCLLGRESEARSGLLAACASDEDPVLRLEAHYLARLRRWEARELPPLSDDWAWLVTVRFDGAPCVLPNGVRRRVEEENWLFREGGGDDAVAAFRHFVPAWSEVALGAALAGGDGLATVLGHWPELSHVLALDPRYQGDRAALLPAALEKCLQLWNVIEIWPRRGVSTARVGLGDFCPDPIAFDLHPFLALHDAHDRIGLFDGRAHAPPYYIELDQPGDRFMADYDRDILAPLRALAAHASDCWLFLADVNEDFVDELYFRDGRLGFRRWYYRDCMTEAEWTAIDGFRGRAEALIERLRSRAEERFRSERFRADPSADEPGM
jgi:hypothetical protein